MSVFFPSHEITIRRLRKTSGYSSNFSATYTAYQADIQPADVNRTGMVDGGRIGTLYEAWVNTDVPIKEADQITANGQTYSVKSVNYYRGAGLLDHKHLILIAQDASN